MQNAKVIDADGHVQDRDAEIRKFMAEPYCRRPGPHVAKDKWDSSMYGKRNRDIHDAPTRLGDMDREGLDIPRYVCHQRLRHHGKPGEKDYAAAFCRGYNDWIANLCKESPAFLKGIGLVPFQDVPAAVTEVNRAVTQSASSRVSRSRPSV